MCRCAGVRVTATHRAGGEGRITRWRVNCWGLERGDGDMARADWSKAANAAFPHIWVFHCNDGFLGFNFKFYSISLCPNSF